MSDASPQSRSVLRSMLRDRTFLIATAILVVAAVGWPVAVNALGVWFVKSPVPWTEAVDVDPATWKNVSFPKSLGEQYEMVSGDGVLYREKDGIPDGDQPHEDDILDLLKIGTALDKERIDGRASNWYVSRIYENAQADPRQFDRFWHLAIEYYTGGIDTVPHVPEICLVAGGAAATQSETINVKIADLPAPWNEGFRLRRVVYEFVDPRTAAVAQYVQYYVFSLNGVPEVDRNVVRLELTLPWVRYAYFAKVQFGPRGTVDDIEEADQAAKEFLRAAMPAVLNALPSRQTVATLKEAQQD
ncbi:MAG: hypothetical protein ACLFV7_06145 [Phycisphaerae bacterium]